MLRFLSKGVHGVRLIAGSKLAVGVTVSLKGCHPLRASPVTDWQPFHGGPCDSWGRPRLPRDPELDKIDL